MGEHLEGGGPALAGLGVRMMVLAREVSVSVSAVSWLGWGAW